VRRPASIHPQGPRSAGPARLYRRRPSRDGPGRLPLGDAGANRIKAQEDWRTWKPGLTWTIVESPRRESNPLTHALRVGDMVGGPKGCHP
jgi:hypothetical protein